MDDKEQLEFVKCISTVLANEAALMKLQEDTQRDLQTLTLNVKEMTAVLSSHDELIRTNATLVKELANIVKWLTEEQTKYRQTQSGMLWKVLAAVLGVTNALVIAMIASGKV